jgi:hypothetical protein
MSPVNGCAARRAANAAWSIRPTPRRLGTLPLAGIPELNAAAEAAARGFFDLAPQVGA